MRVNRKRRDAETTDEYTLEVKYTLIAKRLRGANYRWSNMVWQASLWTAILLLCVLPFLGSELFRILQGEPESPTNSVRLILEICVWLRLLIQVGLIGFAWLGKRN